jgi:mevalonate kinase
MEYFSRGKLLITGEYLVLKGALALVTPVKFGQSLLVQKDHAGYLTWESYDMNRCWFKAKFDTTFWQIIESTDLQVANRLLSWLKSACILNPRFASTLNKKKVVVNADFDLSWGLGSSSSLLSDIAFWAEVDPFDLHRLVSKGSGYDVVSARENGPSLFRLSEGRYEIEKAEFNPKFREKLFFVYLGHKQDSSKSVNAFLTRLDSFEKEIEAVTALSERMIDADTIFDFEVCIREHEGIISVILGQKRIKDDRFADLTGEIKSLGAWGGDFAMMTWSDSKDELKKYLKTKDIYTVFGFDEIIKTR